MFPLPIKMWLYIGILVVIAGLSIAVKVQTSRLDAVKTEFESFRASVKAEGDEAERRRLQDILDRKAITDKQEADNAKRYASLDASYRAAVAAARVSGDNSGSGEAKPLSSAAAVLSCPDRQSDVADRLASLEVGVLALLERGDKAIERTITCKAWIDEQVAKTP